MSLPQGVQSSLPCKSPANKTETCVNESGTSYEVFRNNTTAVEVVVKDVHKGKRKAPTVSTDDMKVAKLQADVQRLRCELDYANKSLAKTRKGYQVIIHAMRKQINTATVSDSEAQAVNLSLKLENEKLKVILESKTKLLCKLKKEMTMVKRILKFVIKSICNVPEMPETFIDSEPECDVFGTDEKKFLENDITHDTTISDGYYFPKKL